MIVGERRDGKLYICANSPSYVLISTIEFSESHLPKSLEFINPDVLMNGITFFQFLGKYTFLFRWLQLTNGYI